MLQLQQLESERQILQQRQAELEKMEQSHLLRQHHQQHQHGSRGFHNSIQAAVNATQEMLMQQNLNGDIAPTAQAMFDSLSHRPLEMQHSREESADSGLGMGSNFNLGSIPEDVTGMEAMDSMDTGDLDTTLTDPGTPTPAAALICSRMQRTADSNMESGKTLIPNLQPDLADDFQKDMMQTILNTQNQQSNPISNEGPLTWL
jgi:protein yorkie